MQEQAVELNALSWAAGWLVAVLLLFAVGLRLPLATGSYAGMWVMTE